MITANIISMVYPQVRFIKSWLMISGEVWCESDVDPATKIYIYEYLFLRVHTFMTPLK